MSSEGDRPKGSNPSENSDRSERNQTRSPQIKLEESPPKDSTPRESVKRAEEDWQEKVQKSQGSVQVKIEESPPSISFEIKSLDEVQLSKHSEKTEKKGQHTILERNFVKAQGRFESKEDGLEMGIQKEQIKYQRNAIFTKGWTTIQTIILRNVFEKCGDIEDIIAVPRKGFAFLVFKTQQGMVNALKKHSAKINGKRIVVQRKKEQRKWEGKGKPIKKVTRTVEKRKSSEEKDSPKSSKSRRSKKISKSPKGTIPSPQKSIEKLEEPLKKEEKLNETVREEIRVEQISSPKSSKSQRSRKISKRSQESPKRSPKRSPKIRARKSSPQV